MNRTCRKIVRAVGLAAALTVIPSVSSAIAFNWSFDDVDAGRTVKGMVLGLTDNTLGQAEDVVITDDGSLSFGLPQSTIDGATANLWDVWAGQITSVIYVSEGFDDAPDFLVFLGSSPNNTLAVLFDDVLEPEEDLLREGLVTFTAKSSSVPEPATLLLLGLGLAGLGFARKRLH